MGEEAKQEEQATAATKTEEKKEEKAEEKKEEKAEEKKEEAKPPSPLVLYVDLHCVGCAKKIERSIMKFRGVEEVVIDMAQNQVTVKGIVDPQAVCTKIIKKTKRNAVVLSPPPAATEGDPTPEVATSQASEVTTVELNVNMHCEACADQLKRKILKMRGVQKAETELSTGKVTVTGTMNANRLAEYVYRRTKKQARIVPQPEPEKKDENPEAQKPDSEKKEESSDKKADGDKAAEEAKKKTEEEGGKGKEGEVKDEKGAGKAAEVAEKQNEEEEEGERMKRMMYYYQPLYVIERLPPPQMFSDENPNACCIS